MLTAEQKIRHTLTGSPSGEPIFQHDGEEVTRWITGGTLPDIYVTFYQRDTVIEARCAICRVVLGCFPAHYGGDTAQQLVAMRQMAHQHEDMASPSSQ